MSWCPFIDGCGFESYLLHTYCTSGCARDWQSYVDCGSAAQCCAVCCLLAVELNRQFSYQCSSRIIDWSEERVDMCKRNSVDMCIDAGLLTVALHNL